MPKKEFDFIAHWANYCREHPDDAKRQNSRFINSMYDKHYTWKDDLLLKPNGVETLSELYSINNPTIINMWKDKAKELQSNL